MAGVATDSSSVGAGGEDYVRDADLRAVKSAK
jgi:hypothetical protein